MKATFRKDTIFFTDVTDEEFADLRTIKDPEITTIFYQEGRVAYISSKDTNKIAWYFIKYGHKKSN